MAAPAMGPRRSPAVAVLLTLLVAACRAAPGGEPAPARQDDYDVVIEGGRVVDGAGNPWFHADVALRGDRIARVAAPGMLRDRRAARRVDARGLVVAPGFIDIQAQSYADFMLGEGRAVSMVTQGITTAILGEGSTPAPRPAADTASPYRGPRAFAQWLDGMAARGLAQNVGSFLGAATVRAYAMGSRRGAPSAAELDTMRAVTVRAMQDGAFGVASALIYAPGSYATTEELVALARAIAPFGGVYVTHLRSEGDFLLEALDEALRIGREGGVPVEIYHLKMAGRRNWPKLDTVIARIEAARAAGQDVTADMYLYVAGGNSMSQCIPSEFHADGRLLANLADPAVRPRIRAAMLRDPSPEENLCAQATPEGILLAGVTAPAFKAYEGKRLADVLRATGKEWPEQVMDLVLAEQGRGPGQILFLMDEANVRRQVALPWMKWGTDAGAQDPATAQGMSHPRGYGNYPRLLGRYVRDERALTLEDAVRKGTSAVAARLGIPDRGLVKEGFKADLIVFDPATIADRSTFEQPHQLSVGMRWVFVNGRAVLADGAFTNEKPGVVVRPWR